MASLKRQQREADGALTKHGGLPQELLDILRLITKTSDDLLECGAAVQSLFVKACDFLSSSADAEPERAKMVAESLISLADDKFLSYPYKDVPTYWRRLYADASILKTIASFSLASIDCCLPEWELQAIRDCDLVLIVAGAPGVQRKETIFSLIALLQLRLPPPSTVAKRSACTPCTAASIPTPPIHNPIPILTSPPTLTEYHSLLSETPFILKAGCSDWPASSSPSKWKSLSYLSLLAGKGRVVPVEVGNDYTSEDWGQEIILFDDFLDSLSDQEEKEEDKKVYYLAQHDLFRQFPDLLNDIEIPDYVYTPPPHPAPYKEATGPETDDDGYKPPGTEEGYTLNAWLGPAGTLSPAHTDPYYNCFAQVVGKKWVWVAPPSVAPFMSSFGSPPPSLSATKSTLAEPLTAKSILENPNMSLQSLMTNTSTIDVSLPLSDEELRIQQPEYASQVLPKSMQAVLEEGDLFFMPPRWWHSLKSLQRSFSVSIWF